MPQVVAVVPTINRSVVILNGQPQVAKDNAEAIELFESLNSEDIVLAIMGGPAPNLLARASQMGLKVRRIPWFVLDDLVPNLVGANATDRAVALQDAWARSPMEFYPMIELDQTIFMIRDFTRSRLIIQEIRKRASNQVEATKRNLEPIMPDAKPFAAVRAMFANPAIVAGGKADEKVLEQRITALAKTLDIWSWLHPGKDAVLPEVKGLGPSLGGSIIGEIGDIRRFPSPSHLRAYARFHVVVRPTEPGEVPTYTEWDEQAGVHVGYVGVFPYRRAGRVSNWNTYLNRAVWLWTTDQMPRYEHVWRDIYFYFKWRELMAHPEPLRRVVAWKDATSAVPTKTITYFTLGHLDKRAKRKTGSALLKYIWRLWNAGDSGKDLDRWFKRTQSSFFCDTIAREVENGLYEKVRAEVERRRNRETKPEKELED
jgi:hypothetical protein